MQLVEVELIYRLIPCRVFSEGIRSYAYHDSLSDFRGESPVCPPRSANEPEQATKTSQKGRQRTLFLSGSSPLRFTLKQNSRPLSEYTFSAQKLTGILYELSLTLKV